MAISRFMSNLPPPVSESWLIGVVRAGTITVVRAAVDPGTEAGDAVTGVASGEPCTFANSGPRAVGAAGAAGAAPCAAASAACASAAAGEAGAGSSGARVGEGDGPGGCCDVPVAGAGCAATAAPAPAAGSVAPWVPEAEVVTGGRPFTAAVVSRITGYIT